MLRGTSLILHIRIHEEYKCVMSYQRVLLIKPSYKGSYYGAFHPPVGIGYIAETLASHEIEYDVMDMSLRHSLKGLLKKVRDFRPDLVGVTMMSFMYEETYRLIRRVKETRPQVKVVIGGAHASTYREQILEKVPEIDYVITLEGEETMQELCSGMNVINIRGLAHRVNGRGVYNGDRRFIQDLDRVPFPRYRKFELSKYIFHDIDIASSRGCPHQCIFCSVKAVSGRQLRVRSPSSVVDEMEYWYRRGYRKFNFVDDNFTFYRDRVLEICDEIEKRRLRNLRLTNANGIRADKTDRSLLKRMKSVGFYYIGFGVECGNDKVLKNIKKGETISQIKRAIADAVDLGYEVVLYFLVGSPGETWRDMEDSVKLATQFPVLDVRFGNITPTPKSELFDWIGENGLFVRRPEDYLNQVTSWSREPVFFTPEMSVAERRRALDYTARVRKRILEKAFVRKMRHMKLIARLLAPLAVSERTMDLVMHSKGLLKIAEAIRRA